MEKDNLKIPDWYVCEAVCKAHTQGARKPTALELFIYDFEPASRTDAYDFRDQVANVISENCGRKCDSGNGLAASYVEQYEFSLEQEPE